MYVSAARRPYPIRRCTAVLRPGAAGRANSGSVTLTAFPLSHLRCGPLGPRCARVECTDPDVGRSSRVESLHADTLAVRSVRVGDVDDVRPGRGECGQGRLALRPERP